MTKISKKQLDPTRMGEYINNLWSAFTLMDNKEDIRLLFKDLFTHTEFQMFAKRLEVARRLLREEGYQAIQIALNVTSGTVGRISNVLVIKGNGLRKAHAKLEKLEGDYLKKQKEVADNLSNPFARKIKNHQKTALGETLKAGILAIDKKIIQKIKENTAKKKLPI